jgi:catechol 2,3-dioxygenase-like lactoylglutathione lyase family enzyme
MTSTIESITLTLDDVGRGLRFFRQKLGLSIVSDSHASVGLLAAWRHPVHESVRLIELAPIGTGTTGIRLIHFEDAAKALRLVSREPISSPRAAPGGPRLLDARPAAPTVALGNVRVAPDDLPWIGSAQREKAGTGAVSWVWIRASGEQERAHRFYTEVLGFAALPSSSESTPQPCPPALASHLGIAPGEPLQLDVFRPAECSGAGVVLFRSAVLDAAAPPTTEPSRRLGSCGVSLVTWRCDDLDALIGRLKALALEPLAAPSHVATPQGLARVMAVRGPEGELLEFVEVSD